MAGFTTFTAPAPSAQAAIAGSLVAGADLQALSASMATSAFPSGSTKAVVAPYTKAEVVHQAAALASSLGAPLILSTSKTSATAINTTLNTLGAKSLYFVSEAATFSAAFRSSLPAGTTIALDVKSDSVFARSTAIAAALPVGPIVVGNTTVANSMNTAGAMATGQALTLILLDGSETDATVQSFFAGRADHYIALVGGATTLKQSLLPPLPDNGLMILDTANVVSAFRTIALQQISSQAAASGSSLWTAPMNQPQSQALAALSAKVSKTSFLPAGTTAAFTTTSPSHEFIKLWGPEATKVTLAGTAMTAAELNSLTASSSITRVATPSWTVTNMQLGSGNYTITVKARSGAVKYQARTLGDAVAGESTSTTITVPGLPGTVTYIAALNASGAIVDTFPMRVNQYQEVIDRESTVVATIRDGGKHHLNWIDDRRVPRLITRYTIDPFMDDPNAPSGDPAGATFVAITCGTEYTTPASDLTKQWVYTVQILSTDGASCGTRGATGMTTAVASGINLPFMAFPAAAKMRSMDAAEDGETDAMPIPGYTVSDQLIVESGELDAPPAPEAESSAQRAERSTSSDSDYPSPSPTSSPSTSPIPQPEPTSAPTPEPTAAPSPEPGEQPQPEPEAVPEIITETAQEVADASPDSTYTDGPPAQARATALGPVAAAPGDDMPTMAVFYMQYIPGKYLGFPGFSGDVSKPNIAFGADNRAWYDLHGSNRTSNQAYVFFGSDYQIINGRDIGTSHKYKCGQDFANCQLTDSGTAAVTTVGGTSGAGPTRAVIGQWVHSPNPVQVGAPAIDGVALWDLKRGGSTLRAEFDRMPVHQFWYGNFEAAAYLAFENSNYDPLCLFNGTQAVHIQGCTVAINTQF